MEFDAVIRKRKSVRSFTSKKPGWKKVLEAIDAALQGSFAGNRNYMKFLILEDKKVIGEIARICEQDWIDDVSILVVVCSDEKHLEGIYGERGRVYSRQQAGAAIQTLLFKLTELGLDSCWVGAYSDKDIRERLEIPEDIVVEAAIPVGYSQEEIQKPRKKSLENALYWGKWGMDRRPTMFDERESKIEEH